MRVSGTFASDERTRGNGRPNTVFLYVDEGTADAAIVAMFQALEPRLNAKLVSVNRQIGAFGYQNLPEGLPGELVKVLCKNQDTGATEQISWVFGNPATTDQQIRDFFTVEAGETALLNRYGDPLGEVIRITRQPLSQE